MSKGKQQNMVECPNCFHHFDRKADVLNQRCTRCGEWRPIVDFGHNVFICKICQGVPYTRFSTQMRIRTKEGKLLKQCTNCKLWKPEENYSKSSDTKDGLQGWCMDCNSKYRKEQRAKPKP